MNPIINQSIANPMAGAAAASATVRPVNSEQDLSSSQVVLNNARNAGDSKVAATGTQDIQSQSVQLSEQSGQVSVTQSGDNRQDPRSIIDANQVAQIQRQSESLSDTVSLSTQNTITTPSPGIKLPSPTPAESSYNAIATGLLALNQEKLTSVLDNLGLTNLTGSIIKPKYLKGELLLFQRLILNKVKAFHQKNVTTIDFAAKRILEASLRRDLKDSDFIPIANFSKSFSGLMPIQLMNALGQKLDVSIGTEHGNDIRVSESNEQHTATFPGERLFRLHLNQPIDLREFSKNRLVQDLKLSTLIEGEQSITLDTLDIIYKNMLHSPMGQPNVLPMYGVTQSQKTSLFNFLLGIDPDSIFAGRVGTGVTSATVLNLSQLSNEISYMDTPGLEENRSELLEPLINYQLIELLYSNNLSNLVITLRRTDLMNLSSGGIRKVMGFLVRFMMYLNWASMKMAMGFLTAYPRNI